MRARADAAAAGGSAGVLRDLGFWGLEPIETSLLAGLVTGDPVLLVGSHGSAKTSLVRRVGAALGLRSWCYDAGKALFEDVIGFPSPTGLQQGVVEYIPTPLSIWDKEFVLVDEVSRAAPSMQNKWLEVVRSRQVMGRSVEGLRFVWGAMNPPDYLGAHPLDAAFAGRFAFVLPMPEVGSMGVDDVLGVIHAVGDDDAPACRSVFAGLDPGAEQVSGEPDQRLRSIVLGAREGLRDVIAELGPFVSRYVLALAGALSATVGELDGRRLGMIRRNLLATIAIDGTQGSGERSERPGDLAPLFARTVAHSLPFLAVGEEVGGVRPRLAHHDAWESALRGGDEGSGVLRCAAAIRSGSLTDAAEAVASTAGDLPPQQLHELVGRVDEALGVGEPAAHAEAALALLHLADTCCDRADAVSNDVAGRVLERAWRLLAYEPEALEVGLEALSVLPAGPSLPGSPSQTLELRAALRWEEDDPYSRDVDGEQIGTRMAALRDAIRLSHQEHGV